MFTDDDFVDISDEFVNIVNKKQVKKKSKAKDEIKRDNSIIKPLSKSLILPNKPISKTIQTKFPEDKRKEEVKINVKIKEEIKYIPIKKIEVKEVKEVKEEKKEEEVKVFTNISRQLQSADKKERIINQRSVKRNGIKISKYKFNF